jgi:Xaa-Pro aminopeptidase
MHRDHSVDLFVDLRKISPQVKDFLGADMQYHPLETVVSYLHALPAKSIIVDPTSAPLALVQALLTQNRAPLFHKDPSLLLRAVKNAAEIIGFVSAHIRDGVALVRFFCWLTQHPSPETLSEIKVADRLEALRREGINFRGLSFNTISAVGPNAAIIHYSPKPATARLLDRHSLYLCDSGAQYLDGTTDVTRTIALGPPTAEQRKHFTLVLKGHIALARARFPYGTTGGQLDILARQYLWQERLDYAHGTGHGVGSYLSVHEGPQRISSAGFQQKLLPGMILSNEPGYYKEGAYGIRLESLVLVKSSRINAGNWLEFQTLTLAPIDLQLIEPSLLSPEEKAWLNDYHRLIYDSLASWLDETTRKWLAYATAAV